jgi:hypothetical protein
MAFERVKFETIPVRPGFLSTSAVLCVPAYLLGWFKPGESIAGITLTIVCLTIVLVIWVIRRKHSQLKAATEAFEQRGYKLDFQLGTLIVDSKAKVLAFADMNQLTIDFYSTRDILEWEHQWVDQTTTDTNVWGNRAQSRTTATQNILVIKTNNPANPVYKVPCLGHAMGQVWLARLSALING